MMAGGALLPAAVRELAALPHDSYERTVAVPALLHFQHSLEHDATRPLAPEEQEFIVVMHKSWDDARAEGRAEERTAILRRQLALKFGELSQDIEQRIAASTPDEIERLIERVLFAETLDALFG
jgi:hypothetical protein